MRGVEVFLTPQIPTFLHLKPKNAPRIDLKDTHKPNKTAIN